MVRAFVPSMPCLPDGQACTCLTKEQPPALSQLAGVPVLNVFPPTHVLKPCPSFQSCCTVMSCVARAKKVCVCVSRRKPVQRTPIHEIKDIYVHTRDRQEYNSTWVKRSSRKRGFTCSQEGLKETRGLLSRIKLSGRWRRNTRT